MKGNGVGKYIGFSVLGLVMLTTGLLLPKLRDAQGVMLTLPYILVGVGSGIFGSFLGTAIRSYSLKKNPAAARQASIEERDERNIAINDKAKARAYDMTMTAFPALILAFALMRPDMYICIALRRRLLSYCVFLYISP